MEKETLKQSVQIMKNIYIIPTDKPSRLWLTKLGNLTRCHDIKPIKEALGNNVNINITSDEKIKKGEYGLSKLNEIIKFHSGYDYRYYKKIILTTDQSLIQDGVQAIDDEFLEWFMAHSGCDEVEVKPMLSNNGRAFYGYKIIIPKEEAKTAWVGVLHDKLNEYHPAKYELKDIYQGEGCLPNFPNKELCQIWCDSKYKEEPKQETLEEAAERLYPTSIDTFTDSGIDLSERERLIFKKGAKWQQERMYSEEDMKKAFIAGGNSQIEEDDAYGSEYLAYMEDWFEQFKKKV